MIHTLTYIHFRVQWHLLGPESPNQQFERQHFQNFLATLNDSAFGDYDDFSYRPDRCVFAKTRSGPPQGGQAFSKVQYANNQLTVVEEWADISADSFREKLVGVLERWFQHFPQTIAIVESCCLRGLVQPANFDKSRHFIGDCIMGLGSQLQQCFRAMPHKVGFEVACVRELPSVKRLMIEAKISSWRDNRSVWVEVTGTAPMERPINAANVNAAEVTYNECNSFLRDEVIGLLTKYDTKSSGEG